MANVMSKLPWLSLLDHLALQCSLIWIWRFQFKNVTHPFLDLEIISCGLNSLFWDDAALRTISSRCCIFSNDLSTTCVFGEGLRWWRTHFEMKGYCSAHYCIALAQKLCLLLALWEKCWTYLILHVCYHDVPFQLNVRHSQTLETYGEFSDASVWSYMYKLNDYREGGAICQTSVSHSCISLLKFRVNPVHLIDFSLRSGFFFSVHTLCHNWSMKATLTISTMNVCFRWTLNLVVTWLLNLWSERKQDDVDSPLLELPLLVRMGIFGYIQTLTTPHTVVQDFIYFFISNHPFIISVFDSSPTAAYLSVLLLMSQKRDIYTYFLWLLLAYSGVSSGFATQGIHLRQSQWGSEKLSLYISSGITTHRTLFSLMCSTPTASI